jgi:lipopolysaccharide transport system permease protein
MSSTGRPLYVVIEPDRKRNFDWRELTAFRELLLILSWRDISVKYKQTFFGFAWVLFRPLLTIAAFTIVFGKLANVPSVGDVPYALVVCTGLLPWYLMSLSFSDAAGSLIGNSAIITKVYFPRMILPISALLVNLADFVVSLLILVIVAAWYGVAPSWQVLLLPVCVLFALAVTLGPSLLFAALNVEYRDFRYIVPFVAQFGLYISPVGFSTAIVPEKWKLLYSLNPAVGVIESFRWCFLGDRSPIYWPSIISSLLFALIFLWLGAFVFRRTEKKFADVI